MYKPIHRYPSILFKIKLFSFKIIPQRFKCEAYEFQPFLLNKSMITLVKGTSKF